MKISYEWLKKYIDPKVSVEELSQTLTAIGLEVEEVSNFESVKGGLQGLLIGEVKECVQHPNADRLRITKTDIGGESLLQIVCGAPNVSVGQKVVVAPVGSKVHPLNVESFDIKEAKIRGELSQGMICAQDEIGLGHSHEGIMVLPADAPIGMLAKDYFQISSDVVFEIGLTPNRPDAASHYGVARDLSAFYKKKVTLKTNPLPIISVKKYFPVNIENSDACPRYAGINIANVQVKESPQWLINRLKAIGVRPVNNIVDVSNYILHDLGQPLHIFDADKIDGEKIIVKTCNEGTPFVTLDGVERKLTKEDLMICDERKPLCMAGVFGGLNSGVSENTQNIFVESAYFNPVWIRKTAKRHGLKTDASFRYERGTDPDMPLIALKTAVGLILEIAGGEISEIKDIYPKKIKPFEITLSFNNVNRLIGKKIDQDEIKSILTYLGLQIKQAEEHFLNLEIPPYKVDVKRECDVIEEILRIHGLDNVDTPNTYHSFSNFSAKPNPELVQNAIADLLSNNGFSEILTNSIGKSIHNQDKTTSVTLLNPLSNDLDAMRQSLCFTGLEVVSYNLKHKNRNLKLYEFGKTYFKIDGKYQERKLLSVFMTGNKDVEHWKEKAQAHTFYTLKGVLEGVLFKLNVKASLQPLADDLFTEAYAYFIKDTMVAKLGVIHPLATQRMEIEGEVFFAELDWDLILKQLHKQKITYQEISKTPAVRRDLSMLVDKNTQFENLKNIALKSEKKYLQTVDIFDVYEGEKLPSNKKSYALSFVFQDQDATLTDTRVDAMMQKITHNLEQEAKAEIRK